MSPWFEWKTIGRNMVFGLLFQETISKKITLIFTDVETEGKKQGYKRAKEEYERSFQEIEEEYRETIKCVGLEVKNKTKRINKYLERLAELERLKESLEECLDNSVIKSAAMMGFPIVDIICAIKERKLKMAKQKGYIEAKELFEWKINKMSTELVKLKEKSDAEIGKLFDLMVDSLDAIAEKRAEIADLRIIMGKNV